MKPELNIKFLDKALEMRYHKQPKLKNIKLKLLSRQAKYSKMYDLNSISKDNEQLDKIEKDRSKRQIQNTILNQKKIKNARAVVFGCGGVGSNVLISLSYSGVNNFKIIDFDKVEISNLNQQTLYYPENIGQLKIDVATKRLLKINPKISVKSYDMKLNYPPELNLLKIDETEYPNDIKEVNEIIKWGDYIVAASDYLGAPYLINDLCIKNQKPFYWGVCNYFLGDIYIFYPEKKTPCLRCIFGPTDFSNKIQFFRYNTPDSPYRAINFGTTNMLTGIFITENIIKDICNIDNSTHGNYIIYDGYDMELYKILLKIDESCSCLPYKSISL